MSEHHPGITSQTVTAALLYLYVLQGFSVTRTVGPYPNSPVISEFRRPNSSAVPTFIAADLAAKPASTPSLSSLKQQNFVFLQKELELMVRDVKNHHPEEEEDEEDFISRTTDGSSQKDGRRNDQKAGSHRSKHSETEQRRRSKINERHACLFFSSYLRLFCYSVTYTYFLHIKDFLFQILRDLIPQNDQKRDRASFLLEVIQYIQFLQEKLQLYEGTYHGWSPEPTKLMPWRGNGGTDTFTDQSHPIKNGSVDEGNIVFPPALLSNTQTLVDPELSAAFTTPESFSNLLNSQSRLQQPPWIDRHHLNENAVQSYSGNEFEELKMQTEEDRGRDRDRDRDRDSVISDAYSKGLLSNLTQTLGSCGVDLSQASISVQFDIRKGASSGSTSTSFGIKEHDFLSPSNQETEDDVYDQDQAPKRLRTQQNQ
ncbi:hypothetical protein LXL04_024204 [Taraxacum kok-saghyz]